MGIAILETLRRRRSDNQAKNQATYADLIRKVVAGAKIDIAKLADAADDLNLSAEQVDADVEALKRATVLEQAIRDAEPNLQAWRDAGPNLKKVIDENNARLVAARGAAAAADSMMMGFVATKQALADLKNANRRLFPAATTE